MNRTRNIAATGKLKTIAFSLLPGLLLFLAIEGVLRISPPSWMACVRTRACVPHDHRPVFLTQQGGNFSLETGEPLFIYDPKLFWKPRPNVSGTFWSTADVRTNEFGLREEAIDLSKKRRNILILGDSVVWGSLVRQEERFSEKAKQLLFNGGFEDVQIINAGVVGYSSFQVFQYLKEQGLRLFKPKVIVICVGINDNWPFHMNDKQSFKRNMKLWRRVRRVFLRSNAFLTLDRYLKELLAFIRTGHNPEGLSFLFREPSGPKRVPRNYPLQTEMNIHRAGNLATSSGAEVMLILEHTRNEQPRHFDIKSFEIGRSRLRNLAHRQGWPVIEIAKLSEPPFEIAVNDYLADFCHLHPRGHEIVGQWLAAHLAHILKKG